jgi:hypothetical protein
MNTLVRFAITGRSPARAAWALGLLASMSLGPTACSRPTRPGPTAAAATGASSVLPTVATAYPRARWRLAPGVDLDRVVLWMSYVLIRDDQSDTGVPLYAGWTPLPPAPSRTREEALALASRIADRADAQPGEFAALAAQYSDDTTTKDSGGSAGGVVAGGLLGDPEVLDALAALRAGAVSHPVETRHGFLVLYRRPVPAKAWVAARRLVVPSSAAPSGSEGAPSARERALTTARDIAAKLRDEPAAFDALLPLYRYQEDAPDGDIGLWTNQEAGPLAREREELARAGLGAVVGPLESPVGFEVLVKTDPAPRRQVAAALVKLPYDEAGGALPTRAERLRTAKSMLAALRKQPAAFGSFQEQYCCVTPQQWSEGRSGSPVLEAAERLPVGGLSEPIDYAGAIHIVTRIAPDEAYRPAEPRFELPAPETPDIASIVAGGAAGRPAQEVVRRVGEEALAAFHLDEARSARFRAIHADLAAAFGLGGSVPARERALDTARQELQMILSSTEYDQYQRIANQSVAALLMSLR